MAKTGTEATVVPTAGVLGSPKARNGTGFVRLKGRADPLAGGALHDPPSID